MRVPIEGERGIGYILRPGFDLPPLMFTAEEAETLMLGLGMGDQELGRQAQAARDKITSVLPPDSRDAGTGLFVGGDPAAASTSLPAVIRQAIREERKLRLSYGREDGPASERVIRPIALAHYNNWLTLTGWCELCGAFRSFRIERITKADLLADHFRGQGNRLRAEWIAGWMPPDGTGI